MVDYVKQLRRHTEGRRAVHIRLSALEKHFREEHYRLFAASALRSVITRFGATMFALPNADLVLITKDARVDDIDPALNTIRRKLRESHLIASLDPVQGVSDEFVVWFDIEKAYEDFKAYVEQLAALLQLGEAANEAESQAMEGPALRLRRPAQQDMPVMLRTPSHVRMMPVNPLPKEFQERHLDPEMLLMLTKAMQGVDVAGLLRRQMVKAILGDAPPMPVLEHKFVPRSLVYETLLTNSRILSENRWLSGYLDDHLGHQVLASTPSMSNEVSMASSIKVTSASVLSASFDLFEKSLGKHPRSKVVLEFGPGDIVTNPVDYQEASRHVIALGYRISVGDLHPLAFLSLDVEPMQAAFVKILKPRGNISDWLNGKTEVALQNKIERIGKARVILDGCEEKTDIDLGHLLGITLFQGHAVDPMTEV